MATSRRQSFPDVEKGNSDSMKGVLYHLMKTIKKREGKHRKGGLLLSLACAGVIATFLAGCAETPYVTAYDSGYYYPTGSYVRDTGYYQPTVSGCA
jgi:hypothetical protein